MTGLEKTLGYEFHDKELLTTALTHSSYLNEHGLRKQQCNERLEFFGDALLEIITTEYLYGKYPDLMEGDLSRKRSACVSEKSLSIAAESISLGSYLRLGKGTDADGGRSSKAILSDAFEALLAALYLDGAKDVAERLIHKEVLIYSEGDGEDGKTKLQEIAQEQGKTVTYRLVSEDGPEHTKQFVYEAMIDGKPYGCGTGRSKKEAQTAAAEETIKRLENGSCI